jgi:hypothetical protein
MYNLQQGALDASVSYPQSIHELLSPSTSSRHGKIIQTKQETEWQT